MRYRIFCCTRPRTGSRDSHTFVANYTNHSRNICGKFKNRRRRESFSFQRRAEIKLSILARTRLKHAFFSQNPTIAKSKTGKASEEIWSTLADSDSATFLVCYINCCYFCGRVRPKNFLSLSLFFFFFSLFPDED